jgi:hypothetical protein
MMRSTAPGRHVIPEVAKVVGLTLASIMLPLLSRAMALGCATGQPPPSNTQASGTTDGTSQQSDPKLAKPGETPATVPATQVDEKRVNELAKQLKDTQDQVAELLKVAKKLAEQGQAPAVEDPSKPPAPTNTENKRVVPNPDSSQNLDDLARGVNGIREQLNQLQTMLKKVPPGSLSAPPFKPKSLADFTKALQYAHASSGTARKVGSTSHMVRQELSTISLKLEASRQSSQGLQSQLRSKATQLAALVRARDAKYLEWYKAQNDEAEATRNGSTQEDIDEKTKKVDELARAKDELDRNVQDTQNQIIKLIECIGTHETEAGQLARDRVIAGLVQEFLKASAGGTGSSNPE